MARHTWVIWVGDGPMFETVAHQRQVCRHASEAEARAEIALFARSIRQGCEARRVTAVYADQYDRWLHRPVTTNFDALTTTLSPPIRRTFNVVPKGRSLSHRPAPAS